MGLSVAEHSNLLLRGNANVYLCLSIVQTLISKLVVKHLIIMLTVSFNTLITNTFFISVCFFVIWRLSFVYLS